MRPPLKRNKILIMGVTILLVLSLNFFQKEVKNFFYLISFPIQKVLWQAGDRTSSFFEIIVEIKELKTENEKLKLKIQELLSENTELKELKRENEDLRKALEIDLKKDFKLILADVSGKDALEDSVLINKGLKEGILKDFPVITPQRTLLGKIDEVYENFSRITLISNKNSSFNAKIITADNGVLGVVRGEGNFRVIFDLMPREATVKEGSSVVTTGFEGIFPEGILVGEIKKIEKNDVTPFQRAKVEPAFNIKELNAVFIISDF